MKESKWIESLKVSKTKKAKFDELLKDLHQGKFRRMNPSDSFKMRVPVLWIQVKKGRKNFYFDNAIYCNADLGAIGFFWGEVYLFDDGHTFGLPRRFQPNSDRILIVCKEEK
jgi:hypothetical protein